MATRIVKLRVCDICGKDEEQVTVKPRSLSLDMRRGKPDLCTDDYQAIADLVIPAINASQKKPSRQRRVPARQTTS